MYYALNILGLKLKALLRHKSTLLIMFILPLLFTYFVSMQDNIENQKYYIVIVDKDRSSISKEIIKNLMADNIKVKLSNEKKAKQIIYNLDSEVAYIFPKGMSQKINQNKIVVIKNYYLKKSQIAPVVNSIVRDNVNKIYVINNISKILSKSSKYANTNDKIILSNSRLMQNKLNNKLIGVKYIDLNKNLQDKDNLSGAAQGSMGFTVFFVMFTIIYAVGNVVDDRRNGTWDRMIVTPASKSDIFLGYMLCSFVQGVVQVLFLIVCGIYLFHVNWGIHITGVLLILISFIICCSSLGLALSSFIKTTSQLNTIAPLLVVATAMLGGCYWPLEYVSAPFKIVAKFVPQGWTMIGLTDIVVKGKGLSYAILPSIMLIFMSILFFSVGTYVLNKASKE